MQPVTSEEGKNDGLKQGAHPVVLNSPLSSVAMLLALDVALDLSVRHHFAFNAYTFNPYVRLFSFLSPLRSISCFLITCFIPFFLACVLIPSTSSLNP